MNEILPFADSLASKSIWTLFLLAILFIIGVGGVSLKWLLNAYREANERLIKCERERADMIMAMASDREKLHTEHAAKNEDLMRETLTTQQRIADTLERFERALERRSIINA